MMKRHLTAFGLAATALTATSAQALAPISSLNVNVDLIGSTSLDESGGYTRAFTDWKGDDGSAKDNWADLSSTGSSSAYAKHDAQIALGIMKASVSTSVSTDNPNFSFDSTSAIANLTMKDSNIITFGSIGVGQTALVRITSFAHVKLSYEELSQVLSGSLTRQNSFSYSSKLTLYESMEAAFSPRLGPSLVSDWNVCSNTRGCTAASHLRNGKRITRRNLIVDSDDVLVIDTGLSLGSGLFVTRTRDNGPGGDLFDIRSAKQTYDFGNSGYTLIEMLTPGTTYHSAAAGFYPASLPPSAVPEPASWAMMITGFGVVGGTMRKRRRAAQPGRVTA